MSEKLKYFESIIKDYSGIDPALAARSLQKRTGELVLQEAILPIPAIPEAKITKNADSVILINMNEDTISNEVLVIEMATLRVVKPGRRPQKITRRNGIEFPPPDGQYDQKISAPGRE